MDILGRDEDELAVVVAHEVAHVVARHSAERLGLKLLTQVASAAITYYVLSRMQGQQRGGQRQQQQRCAPFCRAVRVLRIAGIAEGCAFGVQGRLPRPRRRIPRPRRLP